MKPRLDVRQNKKSSIVQHSTNMWKSYLLGARKERYYLNNAM
jgi:hypothetical protein